MTQQVNLYQPILRREKKVFSALAMLQGLGVIAILMLLLYGFNLWQLQQLEQENRDLRVQQRELAERVATLSRSLQARPESRELRREAEAAQHEAALKERLVALLEDRAAPSRGGFAAAVAGLARQRVPGLWLTGVELYNADATREVALRGMTSRAELVPQLVQKLGEEPAFDGLRFRHMRVFQPEGGRGDALAFELTTAPDTELEP